MDDAKNPDGMSGGKHTAGPWGVTAPWNGFSSIRGGDGALVFGLAAGGADEARPADECEANARLIAAAPDLLEALDPVSLATAAEQCRLKGLAAVCTALSIMADRQSAAIAKATGADR
jgi:hypothetical protein